MKSSGKAAPTHALRVRSFLATTSPAIFDANGQLKDNIQTRAKIYKCRILTSTDIKDLAHHADDASFLQTKLFRHD